LWNGLVVAQLELEFKKSSPIQNQLKVGCGITQMFISQSSVTPIHK